MNTKQVVCCNNKTKRTAWRLRGSRKRTKGRLLRCKWCRSRDLTTRSWWQVSTLCQVSQVICNYNELKKVIKELIHMVVLASPPMAIWVTLDSLGPIRIKIITSNCRAMRRFHLARDSRSRVTREEFWSIHSTEVAIRNRSCQAFPTK